MVIDAKWGEMGQAKNGTNKPRTFIFGQIITSLILILEKNTLKQKIF